MNLRSHLIRLSYRNNGYLNERMFHSELPRSSFNDAWNSAKVSGGI